MTVANKGGLGTGEFLQVLCVLGTGEGLTGCDASQHGRAGHGRVPVGLVRALYSKGRMKPPLKPEGQ